MTLNQLKWSEFLSLECFQVWEEQVGVHAPCKLQPDQDKNSSRDSEQIACRLHKKEVSPEHDWQKNYWLQSSPGDHQSRRSSKTPPAGTRRNDISSAAPAGLRRAIRSLTESGCLRRRCRFMEARVDTLVPHRWQDWASTFSWVRWTCFCSMYSVRYFLSHVSHFHVFPTAAEKVRKSSTLQSSTSNEGREDTDVYSEITLLL